MILARKDFAPKDFAELVAYAKANREKLTMASSGMGSATHLCAMLFQEALGVPLTMVQYKGGAPAMVDVRAGQVDLLCDLPTTTSGQIRSGDVRGPSPQARLPDRAVAADHREGRHPGGIENVTAARYPGARAAGAADEEHCHA